MQAPFPPQAPQCVFTPAHDGNVEVVVGSVDTVVVVLVTGGEHAGNVVVVDGQENDPHVKAQLTTPTSHCAILSASPISQAPSPFRSQLSG